MTKRVHEDMPDIPSAKRIRIEEEISPLDLHDLVGVSGLNQMFLGLLDALSQRALCCVDWNCYDVLHGMCEPLLYNPTAALLREWKQVHGNDEYTQYEWDWHSRVRQAIHYNHASRLFSLLCGYRQPISRGYLEMLLRVAIIDERCDCIRAIMHRMDNPVPFLCTYTCTYSNTILLAILSAQHECSCDVVALKITSDSNWQLLLRIVESNPEYLTDFLSQIIFFIQGAPFRDPEAKEVRKAIQACKRSPFVPDTGPLLELLRELASRERH